MAEYSVAQVDEIDEVAGPGCHYRPIRHHFGISAFGVNAWTGHAPGDAVILEHDADDPTRDEELFFVLRGRASFELDGNQVDAAAGTFVFAAPGTNRRAIAKESGTMIIAIEGSPGKAYEARGRELWAPLISLYGAGEYEEVADRLQTAVETSPQYPLLFFNLACCQSLLGRTSSALDSLRQAVEMSDEFRETAKVDSDLDPIRNEGAFKELIGFN